MQQAKYFVRDATHSDIPLLVDFGLLIGRETYLKTGYLPADYVNGPQRNYWKAKYLQGVIENDKSLMLVVYAAEQLIGMTEVEQIGREEAVMWKLYIDHNYHGQGIGSRLLQEIIDRLPSSIKRLKTEYYDSNKPAARFYKSKGFTFLERKQEQFKEQTISYTYVSKPLERKPLS